MQFNYNLLFSSISTLLNFNLINKRPKVKIKEIFLNSFNRKIYWLDGAWH